MKESNPFPFSAANRRFRTYDYEMKRRYGKKVFKVPLDGGFTCPNLDGSAGFGGCLYCDLGVRHPERTAPRGGASPRRFAVPPLREQYDAARAALSEKWGDAVCIAYFQDFTNTYGEVREVEEMLREAMTFEKVVGLDIATRADALPPEMLGMLRTLAAEIPLTVELGLQTACDETARRINRCHDYAAFCTAFSALREIGAEVCVHLIDGLPGETHETMVQTARTLAALSPDAVKIHLLHVLRGTALEALWRRGGYIPMTMEDYIGTVCDQIEVLPAQTVIARVTGDGARASLLAPLWSANKKAVLNGIDREFVRRGTWQGFYAK